MRWGYIGWARNWLSVLLSVELHETGSQIARVSIPMIHACEDGEQSGLCSARPFAGFVGRSPPYTSEPTRDAMPPAGLLSTAPLPRAILCGRLGEGRRSRPAEKLTQIIMKGDLR